MNQVLTEIIKTGETKSGVKIHSAISAAEGAFIQKLIRTIKPKVSLEVGLAHGISALFICDALSDDAQHIVIDPNQHGGEWGDSWNGIGLENLKHAGHEKKIRFIEEPSFRALAKLEADGERIDFAFIDGWHTFDFTLVDFFFIDRMLNRGGVVVFDDANWPAVRKVCRFVTTNLSYVRVDHDNEEWKETGTERLRDRLRRRVTDTKLGLSGSYIAFRKKADDSRRWDHYRDF